MKSNNRNKMLSINRAEKYYYWCDIRSFLIAFAELNLWKKSSLNDRIQLDFYHNFYNYIIFIIIIIFHIERLNLYILDCMI